MSGFLEGRSSGIFVARKKHRVLSIPSRSLPGLAGAGHPALQVVGGTTNVKMLSVLILNDTQVEKLPKTREGFLPEILPGFWYGVRH